MGLVKAAHTEGRAASINIKNLSELGGLNLDGYRVFQALDLNSYSNGIDGSALILVDERLEVLRGAVKRDPYSGVETLDVEPDPSAWFLPQQDVNEALMLIVDERLRIVYSERLGRESARLDRVFLYQDRSKPTFILTRDYSIGWGSYNGPISYFLEVSGSGIHYILPHGLMTSLKTAWAIVPTNTAAEILSKKCRPDFEKSGSGPMEFKVIYERFNFADGSWHGIRRCAKNLAFGSPRRRSIPRSFRRNGAGRRSWRRRRRRRRRRVVPSAHRRSPVRSDLQVRDCGPAVSGASRVKFAPKIDPNSGKQNFKEAD